MAPKAKPGSVSLSIAKAVLTLADREAALIGYGVSRAEFFRLLVTAADGKSTQVRSSDAPRRRTLPVKKSPLQQYALGLPVGPAAALDRLAAEAGQISRSAVLALLVVDWCGVSPFTLSPAPQEAPDLRSPPLTPSSRTSRADSYVALTLAEPVLALVEDEARYLGGRVGRSQFIRMLVDRGSGVGADISRDPRAPTRKPLTGSKPHTLVRMQLAIAPEQKAGLAKLSFLSGSVSRSAVVAQLLLDWCEMGPFRLNRAIAHGRR